MNNLLKKTFALLLFVWSMPALHAQNYNIELPRYFEIDDAATWTSEFLTFEEPIEGFRMTVFATNTSDTYNGFPVVALAEVDITDTNGDEVTYTATTNSLAKNAGNGPAGLFDNSTAEDSYYHSAYNGNVAISPDEPVYIEFRFDKPQKAFKYKLVACNDRKDFPIHYTLSLLGEKGKKPFNPIRPAEPNGSQDNVEVGSYYVTYMVDGEVYQRVLAKFGSAITPIAPPVKEGYTFSGWSEVPEKMPAEEVIVEGSFSVNRYMLTYMADGNVYKTVSVEYGAAIVPIADPTKEGHTFAGWTNLPTTMPSEDVVVTGTFTVNSYIVSFKVGDEVIYSEHLPFGTEITAPEAPAKEGHTFSWGDVAATVPAGDVTYEGSYTVNNYTVTFKIGNEVVYSEDLPYGSSIVAPEAPVKEGHTFNGWGEVAETVPAGDLTYEGSYSANTYLLTYTVDGETVQADSVVYGTAITALAEPTKEGHTFSGWSEIPATMPAKDVTVTGSFTVNSYTLTYTVDGKEYKKETVAYGTQLTAIDAPTKEGHTFSGWSEVPATMPAKDVTISGVFTINTYLVTFKIGDEVIASDSLTYGAAIVAPEAPEKEGHTFNGWGEIAETVPAGDLTYEGSYSANTYLLTYTVDGETVQADSVVYGTAITALAEPTKEGHTFSGWSEVPETMPAENITITGSFTVNNYTITYIVDSEVYKTESIAYGSKVEAIASPTKEGYTFSGWSGVPATMPAKDVTVNGSFTVNSYTVTYMVDGEVYKTESIAYGSKVEAIVAPTKEGWTFSGWSGVPATMPAKDITVSGGFTVNSYTVTYMVDGEVYKTESVAYGAAITAAEAPAKEGHTFSGWSEVPETMPSENITITGSFTVNSYTVTFILEGELFAEYTLQYGSAIEVPEAPEKEGLTFSGWGKVPETMPAQNLVYEGSYMNNPYTIIYIVDGVEYHRALVEYGSAIALIATPTKEGHTFSGWSEMPETMPAKDVTVTGHFTINKYLVTFKVDDEVIAADSLEYGATIVAPEAPDREGYTFDGWGEVAETVPAGDLTYEGSYSANTYLLTYTVDGETVQADPVVYGTAITALAEPTKEGHTFSGWSEVPATMPAKDVTISGVFTINTYLVTFKIGDEVIAADSLTYGAAIVAPKAPEKEGHTFNGWGEIAETVPAGDVTYEGSYSVNTYLLTYTVDGETVQADSVVYGTPITALADPTKEGHTFSGWSEVPATMPAKDVTISGIFTINTYLVTFKIGDEVIASDSLTYGAAIVAPEAPEKEGYTFNGWGEVTETVPAGDLTYEGSYTANIYKVYYYVGEELVHTAEVIYGEAIPEYIYEPTEEGYTFLGWLGEVYETMPAHDVTYTANIESGINQLPIDNGQLTIYDLMGRKVTDTENLKGGIYIINGKKTVIK